MTLEHDATGSNRDRHCEERSDEAIQRTKGVLRSLDCFAPLAMTLIQGQIASDSRTNIPAVTGRHPRTTFMTPRVLISDKLSPA
ncbi:MAG TPA: hypothetical protein VN637_12275, partial [Roseiarcus sp.]|nr:hypothetical protein [Roseiarcus sp.]